MQKLLPQLLVIHGLRIFRDCCCLCISNSPLSFICFLHACCLFSLFILLLPKASVAVYSLIEHELCAVLQLLFQDFCLEKPQLLRRKLHFSFVRNINEERQSVYSVSVTLKMMKHYLGQKLSLVCCWYEVLATTENTCFEI